MPASSGSSLSAVSTDQPSIRGIMMSRVMTSGALLARSASASSPASGFDDP